MIEAAAVVQSELPDLPDGWYWSTLGELSEKPQYGWTTKANHESGEIKLLRTTDISSGELNWGTVPYCTEAPEDLDKYQINEGDIFISRAGSVGFSYLVKTVEPAVFASYLIRFRFDGDINRNYVYYYLKSPRYWLAIGASASGIAVPNVNAKKLSAVPIPVAPRDQQDRIVAEIEKQFSRLDEAVASLKRVTANLKRYKAAVLKAAVGGKLTEEWRKQNPDVEPASKLLERILAERRAKWEEAELAKMKAKGKEPKNDKWKERYKEPLAPNFHNLSGLPSGWQWSTFERLADKVTVGHVGPMKNEYVDHGVPFLRSQNVRENRYDSTGLKYISENFHEKLSKSSLVPGDLVIVRSGSVGVTCVIPKHLESANCSDLVIVKQPIGIASEFGAFYMNSVVNTRVAAGKVGVALTHFNTRSVATMPVPVPPHEEQSAIVTITEQLLSVVNTLDNEIDAHLRKLAALRTSTLSKAFSGMLLV